MSKRLDLKLVKLSLAIRPGLSGDFKTFWCILGHLWEVEGAPAFERSGAKHSPPSLSLRWPFGQKSKDVTQLGTKNDFKENSQKFKF